MHIKVNIYNQIGYVCMYVIHVSIRFCKNVVHLRLKLSNLACKSASASFAGAAAAPAALPPPPPPSWATIGTFPVAATLIEPEAEGNPDN